MIVQTIPHYRIAEKLGEGGMGLPVRDVSRTFDITNEQPRPLSYEIARQRSRLKGSS